MKSQLESLIKQIILDLYGLIKEINLEVPPSKDLGDFATNIALQISKEVKKNPREVAEEIKASLITKDELRITNIEIAGPGFINLFLNSDDFYANVLTIDENYGKQKQEKPQKIIVEMGDANTHKLPHIGHLFSYLAGDSVARLLVNNGQDVVRIKYESDIGMGISMCLYAWIKRGRPKTESMSEGVKLLQECYQEGRAFYDDEEEKEKIIELNNSLYQKDSDIYKDWLETRQWCLDYQKELEDFLGIEIQKAYLESTVAESGLNAVKAHIGDTFEESGEAVIYPGEKYGLHTRVFITRQGTPTYEAKEIGLTLQKMKDFPFDLTIIPTAYEQNDYFAVVSKAIAQAFPEFTNKIEHIGFGMISLTTGRIASRKGNGITIIDIIDMIKEQITDIINSRENLNEDEKKDAIKKISVSAIRYTFLKSNLLKDMVFNVEESISFEGNSGPYLQYTFARIQSILRQKEFQSEGEMDSKKFAEICNTEEEKDLAKFLLLYPDVTKEAAENRSPHLIATYLFELAQKFNSFYKSHSVNNADNKELVFYRRILSEKTSIVIKLGLKMLGIETVEKM
jgi:arginyl-tRNA synthetase